MGQRFSDKDEKEIEKILVEEGFKFTGYDSSRWMKESKNIKTDVLILQPAKKTPIREGPDELVILMCVNVKDSLDKIVEPIKKDFAGKLLVADYDGMGVVNISAQIWCHSVSEFLPALTKIKEKGEMIQMLFEKLSF